MKVVIYSLIIASIFLFSCRVKETCELQHTGEVFVTNNTSNSLEVFIDNGKVFDLLVGETKSINKSVGNYTVKCLAFPEEWTYDAVVIECESVEINVPE